MFKKVLAIVFLILFCFTVSTSCKKEETEEDIVLNYNARDCFSFYRFVIDSNVDDGIHGLKEEFLLNNRTLGIPLLYVDSETGEYKTNDDGTDNYPKVRYYIIKSEAEAEEVFEQINDVNFETQMIVIVSYTTTCGGGGFGYKVLNIVQEESKLKIEVRHKNYFNGTEPSSVQIAFGEIMDKLDNVAEVEVVLKTETVRQNKRRG